ncbi:hypothetical protein GCM10011331_09090 [Flavimobilis marinus]|uniref:SprT-like family protein n=1 Tax=Flavimobilis marinus TaxID=285351 RepID=A0A1I2CDZ0_9MICO|nr:hypothetical protein [Flavimobilis marinus]GHG47848.1 hypothetical protein GCM10011331_09090 [Flavimobilis marinus]SFE66345.1 hypothetical protein SAMN04488035_0081 [Flavimobilis marinus]
MITTRRRRATLVALVCAALALPLAAPASAAPTVPSRALVAPAKAAPASLTTAASDVQAAPLATARARSSMKLTSYEKLASTHKRTYVKVRVTNGKGQRLSLQRYSKGKWRTVTKTRAPRAVGAKTVKIRVPKKAGSFKYRVVMSKSSANKRIVSKKVRVFQSDYAKHKRYIAKARAHMKRWCPDTPIFVDTPNVRAGEWAAGMAWTRWSFTGSKASWKQTIELRSGLTGASLKHIAIHECAHIVQARPIVKGITTYEKSEARTDKIFRKGAAEPHEQQADCMAYAKTRDKSQMVYTKSCSGKRLKNAKGMWKSYGTKYQKPNLTWAWRY